MKRSTILIKIPKRDSKHSRVESIISKLILYLGLIILISALIYMIVNLDKADLIISLWLPFIIAGVFLVFLSQMIIWRFFRMPK
jgi:hypothetical protein